MKKFDVTKLGETTFEQLDNIKLTDAEEQILKFAFDLGEELFSDDDFFNLAMYFAEHNGLN